MAWDVSPVAMFSYLHQIAKIPRYRLYIFGGFSYLHQIAKIPWYQSYDFLVFFLFAPNCQALLLPSSFSRNQYSIQQGSFGQL